MNEAKLSSRLQMVANHVPEGSILADIGSDHAYLPAYLVLNKKIERAIAGEVVKGPYESALKLVRERNLTKEITVRLADGLEAIELMDGVTAISICGMGGKLISDILVRGEEQNRLSGKERLILQPNVGEKNVRLWLQKHQYAIVAEEIIEEDEKIYEMIVAEKCSISKEYSEIELTFGPFLSSEKTDIFLKKWHRELEHRKNIHDQILHSQKKQADVLERLDEEIKQIKEMIR